ncbi:phage tail protein [Macrococcus capreoli]|uniref:phage tail protein n=1 Tax=Macrococcus capreoli TaxID=2982690 RepID=UPI0021D58746|nr:phage tail protein [Macrococcus sp. TMW 2.2395]MCU7556527.1 phage tail protein [Macrococcus sp. TMW 2.2395]
MIYLFDKSKKLIGTVRRNHCLSALFNREVNGLYTLSVDLPVKYTDKLGEINYYDKISKSSYIGHYDLEGRFQLHRTVVVDVEDGTIHIEGVHIFFDEAKAYGIIAEKKFLDREISYIAPLLFCEIGWTMKDYDPSPALDVSFYDVSLLAARKKLIETFGYEMDIWLDFDGLSVTGKNYSVKKRIGKDTNKRYVYGTNVLKIKSEEDYGEVYTAVIGLGADQDEIDKRKAAEQYEKDREAVRKQRDTLNASYKAARTAYDTSRKAVLAQYDADVKAWRAERARIIAIRKTTKKSKLTVPKKPPYPKAPPKPLAPKLPAYPKKPVESVVKVVTEQTREDMKRRVNYASVVWAKPTNPLDKAAGTRVLVDPITTDAFGYRDSTGKAVPKVKVVVFEDVEDPKILIQKAYEWLTQNNRPKAVFTAEVIDGDVVDLGDTVYVIYEDINKKEPIRVAKAKDNLLTELRTIEFGDLEFMREDDKMKEFVGELKSVKKATKDGLYDLKLDFDVKFADQEESLKTDFEIALEEAQVALDAFAEDMNVTIDSAQEDFMESIDVSLLRAQEDAEDAAFEMELRLNGEIDAARSELSEDITQSYANATKYADDKATALKTEVSNDINTAKTTLTNDINTSYTNATKYADTKASELQTKVATDINNAKTSLSTDITNSYNNAVTQAQVKVDTAKTALTQTMNANKQDADNNISTLNTALGDATKRMDATDVRVNGLVGDIGTLNTQFTDINGQLVPIKSDILKNSGDISSVKNTVAGHTTDISTLNNQITLKATKTELTDAIGGLTFENRNLLEKSATMNKDIDKTWGSYVQLHQIDITSVSSKVAIGDVITVSFDIQMTTGTIFQIYDSNGQINVSLGQKTWNNIGTTKQRLSYTTTLKAPTRTPGSAWTLTFYNTNNGDKFTIDNIKIEKGAKATPYSQAPEDLEGKITKNTADIMINAEEIAKRVLKTDFDSKTGQMQTQINTATSTANENKQTIAVINGDIDKIEEWQIAKGTTIQQTADAINQKIWNTDINTATGAINNRLNTVSSTVDGNSQTILQHTSQINGLTTWQTEKGAIINQTQSAINQKVWQTDITGAIDNLDYGTRNLFVNNTAQKDKCLVWSTGALNAEIGSVTSDFIEVSANDTILSNYATSQLLYYDDKGWMLDIGGNKNGGNKFTIHNDSRIKYMKVSYRSNFLNGQTIADKKVMIVKGAKMGDYQPAIEDTDARISKAESDINVNATAISQRVLKTDFDSKTGQMQTQINTVTSTANNNSSLITQVKGTVDGLSAWKTQKGTLIDQAIDAVSTKVWQNDINAIESGNRNLIRQADFKDASNTLNLWTILNGGGHIANKIIVDDTRFTKVLKHNLTTSAPVNGTTVPYSILKMPLSATLSIPENYTFVAWMKADEQTNISYLGLSQGTTLGGTVGNAGMSIGTTWQLVKFTTSFANGKLIDCVELSLERNETASSIYIAEPMLVKGTLAPSSFVPALEDAENKMSEISQTADSAKLQADTVAKDYVKQSAVIVQSDGVMIGSKKVSGTEMASAISVTPSNVDIITRVMRISADMQVAGDIQTLSINAVNANIATIRTNMLTADTISSTAIKVDTALINKLNTNAILTNYLTADTAMINSIKSNAVTAVRADIAWLKSNVITADSITSTALKVDTALINKLNTNAILTNMLVADTAMINAIKSNAVTAVRADIAWLKANVITADSITSTALKVDTALITKLNTGDILTNALIANTAFIDSIKAKSIEAVHADVAWLKANVITAGSITSNAIASGAVTADKMLVDQAYIDKLMANTAFIDSIKTKSMDATRANIGEISSLILKANVITSTHLSSDLALIDKIFATDALVSRLTAKSAFIRDIKSIEISADRINGGILRSIEGSYYQNLNTGVTDYYNDASIYFHSEKNQLRYSNGTSSAGVYMKQGSADSKDVQAFIGTSEFGYINVDHASWTGITALGSGRRLLASGDIMRFGANGAKTLGENARWVMHLASAGYGSTRYFYGEGTNLYNYVLGKENEKLSYVYTKNVGDPNNKADSVNTKFVNELEFTTINGFPTIRYGQTALQFRSNEGIYLITDTGGYLGKI